MVSVFWEWPFYTGFTVYVKIMNRLFKFYENKEMAYQANFLVILTRFLMSVDDVCTNGSIRGVYRD